MFSKLSKMGPAKQNFFAVLIAFAVVAFWRGAWGLLDVYLIPDDYVLSSWISLCVSLIILLITHYATKELM